jgi:hypothetical protein
MAVNQRASGVGRLSCGVSGRTPVVRRQWAEVIWCPRWVPPVALDVRCAMRSVGFVSHTVRRFASGMRFNPQRVIVSRRGVDRLPPRVRLPLPPVTRHSRDVRTVSRSVQYRSRGVNRP